MLDRFRSFIVHLGAHSRESLTERSIENAQASTMEIIKATTLLLLVAFFVQLYGIEEGLKLNLILWMVIGAVPVFYSINLKYRLLFLQLVMFGAVITFLGVLPGLAAYLILFILAYLLGPGMSDRVKIGLSLSVLGVLAFILTTGVLPKAWMAMVTFVGVVLMFRLILVVYESWTIKLDSTPGMRLSYFLMLPTLPFYIFPIIDYKTFVRSYVSQPSNLLFRKGITLISRGVFHIFLYRLIYFYLLPSPTEVEKITDLLIYASMSYAMVVRISGMFHISLGVLALFGFDLPPAFNKYFLSSGFNDLWRRINIYWKDFVLKVFYFPILFAFKNRNRTAVFISVMITFFVNWFLHSYQWFWIKGKLLLKSNDMLFWLIFGIAVGISSVLQVGRRAKKVKTTNLFSASLSWYSLKIMGIFFLMSFLWTFWTSSSLKLWLQLMSNGWYWQTTDLITLGLSLASIFAILQVAIRYFPEFMTGKAKNVFPTYSGSMSYMIIFIVLLVVGNSKVKPVIEKQFGFDLAPVVEMKLNTYDRNQLFKGYYENLVDDDNFNSRLHEVRRDKPDEWQNVRNSGVLLMNRELNLPYFIKDTSLIFKQVRFTINKSGLRDQEYSETPDSNVFRIALMGGSNELGSGTEDNKTFESLLEAKVNESGILGERKLEIVNFSLPGIHIAEQLINLKENALPFKPDAALYVAHFDEGFKNTKSFFKIFKNDRLLDLHPTLKPLAEKVNEGAFREGKLRFQDVRRHADELTKWGLDEFQKICEDNNMLSIYMLIPLLEDGRVDELDSDSEYLRYASEIGLDTMSFSGAFDDHKAEDLILAAWDFHYSEKAHFILSEAMYKRLEKGRIQDWFKLSE